MMLILILFYFVNQFLYIHVAMADNTLTDTKRVTDMILDRDTIIEISKQRGMLTKSLQEDLLHHMDREWDVDEPYAPAEGVLALQESLEGKDRPIRDFLIALGYLREVSDEEREDTFFSHDSAFVKHKGKYYDQLSEQDLGID